MEHTTSQGKGQEEPFNAAGEAREQPTKEQAEEHDISVLDGLKRLVEGLG